MSKPLRLVIAVALAAVAYWAQFREKNKELDPNNGATEQSETVGKSSSWDSKKKTKTLPRASTTNSSYSSKPKPTEGGTSQLRSTSGTRLKNLFRAKKSKVVVEVIGEVKFTLRDDNEGHRHQQWVMEFENGHTCKVAHNIDLAPRVPLEKGDLLHMRGQYEWAEKGGVIHWTHHDPGGRRPGGWIKHEGKTYK